MTQFLLDLNNVVWSEKIVSTSNILLPISSVMSSRPTIWRYFNLLVTNLSNTLRQAQCLHRKYFIWVEHKMSINCPWLWHIMTHTFQRYSENTTIHPTEYSFATENSILTVQMKTMLLFARLTKIKEVKQKYRDALFPPLFMKCCWNKRRLKSDKGPSGSDSGKSPSVKSYVSKD